MVVKIEKLAADLRETQIQANEMGKQMDAVNSTIDRLNQNIYSLLQTRANTPAAPVANLLWNGEMGHSVNTWHDTAYTTDDKSKECAWWYSHNKPASPQTFTISSADTLLVPAHPFTTGQTVDLLTTGTLPTGLTTGTVSFVIVIDVDHIKLASTVANAFNGTARPITAGTGSGTHTIQEILIGADARTTSTNNELKETTHSTWNARYSHWNSQNGWGELTGTMGIEQLMPSNLVDATTPLARVSLIAAKKNSFIEIVSSCLMGAGIWDNTSGQRKFLEGSIGLSASVTGTPATTIERRYRILLTSDQGYSLLSSEVTLANAPKDSEFSSTVNIPISWLAQAGQLQVDIYEYLPTGPEGVSGPEYRLIAQISSATSYIHLGTYLRTVSGYPTPTGSTRTATFFTETGDLALLNTNGVDFFWNTVSFPIGVPNNYNKANTTDRQWLRIWLTVAPNLFMTGCTTDGTTTVVLPAGAVDSTRYGTGAGSLYFGLTVQVYDSTDVLIGTYTIASVTDDTHIVLSGSPAAGSGRKVRIIAGGFHGVYIDKIHLGYQQNTSYAPNPFDIRTLQPVAAPSSSSQGGVGTGGDDGGGLSGRCVASDTPIKQANGEWQEIIRCKTLDRWSAGGMEINTVVKLHPGFEFVRRVVTANGCWIECTDTEKFMVSRTDIKGTPLYRLRVGDIVMTEIDDRVQESRIIEITPHLYQRIVYTPTLSSTHLFIAGRLRERGLRRFLSWLTGRERKGGFVLHNKPIGELN